MSSRRDSQLHPRAQSRPWRELFRFHAPLAFNAMLLALAGPILNVVIGRAADAGTELAAFWIAFTVVLFAQGVCGVMQQVTLALSERRGTPGALAASALVVGLAAAGAVLAVASRPVSDAFFTFVIPCTPAIAARARQALVTLAVIPPLVALRSVAGGLIVASRRTHLVALTTLLRVGVLALGAAMALRLGLGAGARAAAALLTLGVATDTAFMAAAALRQAGSHAFAPLPSRASLRAIARLAGPLAVATLAWTATRGVIHAVLGHLPGAALAQAAFGVLLPLVMVSCAPLWALLELSLVLPRSRAAFVRVLGYAAAWSVAASAVIALATLTPDGQDWIANAFRLTPELRALLAPVLGFVSLAPALVAARAIAQAVLMRARCAGVLLATGPVRLVLLVAGGLLVAHRVPSVNGAALALALLLAADASDAVILGLRARAACLGAGGLEAILRGSRPAAIPAVLALASASTAFEPGESRSAA